MESEERMILEQNLEISRESLKILKGIRRANRISAFFKVLYWLLILGILAGAYYFLEPYLKNLTDFLQKIQQIMPR